MRAAHALSQSTALIASTPAVAALFRPVGWRGDDVQQCTLERENAPPVDEGLQLQGTVGSWLVVRHAIFLFTPPFVQALLLDAPPTATEYLEGSLAFCCRVVKASTAINARPLTALRRARRRISNNSEHSLRDHHLARWQNICRRPPQLLLRLAMRTCTTSCTTSTQQQQRYIQVAVSAFALPPCTC